MKYALLVYADPSSFTSLSESEQEAVSTEYMALVDAPGVFGGAQLQPVETATTVRVEDGQTLTTDGPFANTKEIFGGYYLLETDNLDAAIEMASRLPAARMGGGIEVRPIVER